MQSEFLGGDGTYTKDRHIFASLTGLRTIVAPKTGASAGVSSLGQFTQHGTTGLQGLKLARE